MHLPCALLSSPRDRSCASILREKQEAADLGGIEFFALKALAKKAVVERGQLAHVKDEKLLLQNMNHPLILGLFSTFQVCMPVGRTHNNIHSTKYSRVFEGDTTKRGLHSKTRFLPERESHRTLLRTDRLYLLVFRFRFQRGETLEYPDRRVINYRRPHPLRMSSVFTLFYQFLQGKSNNLVVPSTNWSFSVVITWCTAPPSSSVGKKHQIQPLF